MFTKFTRRLGILLFGLFILAACEPQASTLGNPSGPILATDAVLPTSANIPLGVGDTIEVTILRNPDLSGTFDIAGDGRISLALIGAVDASGRAVGDVEQEITERYRGGFLRDPNVTVRVTTYRPVSVLGGVNNPGNLVYRPGMTVLAAIAAAGGLSREAIPGAQPLLVRASNRSGTSEFANVTDPIFPGDVVEIPSRIIR